MDAARGVKHENLFYMELKPNIHSAQVVVSARDCRNIEIRDESLLITLAAAAEPVAFDLSTIPHRLRAGTCAGLQKKVCSHEVHFRLQTKPSSTGGRRSSGGSCSLLESLRSAGHASCRACSARLFSISQFTRILDMPSEGWAEMADTWFCHDHDHDGHEGRRPAAIAPRDHELLVGEYYLLISRAVADRSTLTCSGKVDVQCRRCRRWLGEVVEGVTSGVKLCFTDLELERAPGDDCSAWSNPESCFLSWIMAHSSRHACVRFLLLRQSAGKLEPYLLLWLIDAELQLLFGDRSGELRWCRGRKVLYMSCPFKDSRLTEQWKSDSATHTIELPHKLCLKLLMILKRNTERMPVSLMKIGDFFVGFLADSERISDVRDIKEHHLGQEQMPA